MNKAVIALVLVAAVAAFLYLSAPQEKAAEGSDISDEYITLPSGDEILKEEYETGGTGAVGEYQAATTAECGGMEGINRDECIKTAAVEMGDESMCAGISGYEARGLCYWDVAEKKDDAELCAGAGEARDMCYAAMAIEKNSAELCMKAGAEQDYCAYQLAMKTLDGKFCAMMSVNVEGCYFTVARKTNNVSLCEKAGASRDVCIAEVAYSTNNPALCEKAGNPEECYAQLE